MKMYMSGRQLRLVGKGWEIRRKLQIMIQVSSKDGDAVSLDKLLAPYRHQVSAVPSFKRRARLVSANRKPRLLVFPSSMSNLTVQ